ncbi:aspartate/glutamate racemase family protein [Dactylosporangium sucinum]|uniref:Hydantoin racemase n=1 Tax=Dactylosporangium sucinum TaxID=1424081 RepID=A0A917U0G7_9ACTN|nr:aspartate/glutamate racemase family protein [Dactylosporangium sucinum]GGM45968.1 hypothetical protein GCM10007977_054640 [Dactylosporangium sucinum]
MNTAPLRLAMINSDGKSAPPLPDPEGVVTELYELRLRAFARTPYDQLFTELGTLDAAEAAIAAGCDAIYIDTFADYAIERVRTAAGVPVIGAGAAAVAAAGAHGRRFSVVTVWPESMAYLYDERLANCSGGQHCAGVHFFSPEDELGRLGTRAGVKARMLRRESDIVDRLAEACRSAVRADGAEAVLLGCTCMSPIAGRLAECCDFPVLDASALGQQAAFDALRCTTAPAPRARSLRAGTASRLVDTWLASGFADEPSPDECDVCVIALNDPV